MAEFEVVAVDMVGLSRDDCRCIDQLYCVADDGTEHTVRTSQAYFDLRNGDQYYMTVDGQRHDLQPATKFNSRYVRAHSEDTSDDPLLSLPAPDEQEPLRS